MTGPAPAVSVVMAAYNGTNYLSETIARLLAQSFADFELVVVDDRSTDGTLALLRGITDPRVRVIAADANGGPVLARNRAFAEARGRYIAGLDHDDLCHPDRLARQVAYLDAHPETALVATDALLLEEGTTRAGPWVRATTPAFLDWLLLLGNPLVWSSVMFRADAARRLSPFTRPERLYAEDFDLYHRLRAHGGLARIDAPLVEYRVHPGGASKRHEAVMAANAERVLAEAFAAIPGIEAAAGAALVVRHVMTGAPAPDLPTLRAVLDVIARLRAHIEASRPIDAATRTLLGAHHARLWRGLARAAVRSGTLGLRDAFAIRPEGTRWSAGRPADLAFSRLVGAGRRAGLLGSATPRA